MKRASCRLILFLLLGVSVNLPLQAANNAVLPTLRLQWDNTRKLILAIAEAIPEDKYDYKPAPETRTFREQLAHIASENHGFMGQFATKGSADYHQFDHLKTRAELLKALAESYDYGEKVMKGLTEEQAAEVMVFRGQQMPRWGVVISNIVDNMDHYGNLVVYFRLNKMVPPRTTFFQQQRQLR